MTAALLALLAIAILALPVEWRIADRRRRREAAGLTAEVSRLQARVYALEDERDVWWPGGAR